MIDSGRRDIKVSGCDWSRVEDYGLGHGLSLDGLALVSVSVSRMCEGVVSFHITTRSPLPRSISTTLTSSPPALSAFGISRNVLVLQYNLSSTSTHQYCP